MKLLLKRTNQDKAPSANTLDYGELAMSYSNSNPSLYIKDENDKIIRFVNQDDLDSTTTLYEGQLDEKLSIDDATVEFAKKQDVLTEGVGIKIENNVIRADIDTSLYIIVQSLPTENINDNKIYLLLTSTVEGQQYDEYIHHSGGWERLGLHKSDIPLDEYIKTVDADAKYLSKDAKIVIESGSVDVAANNGQAFLAIRDVGAQSITSKPLNGASFGVKLDGTAAFSHKTYDSYNPDNGKTTGARNTAVLTFSGPTGLRYAKNTGSAADVTEAMYRYIGVIDSDTTDYRVYSKKEVDALLLTLKNEIASLKARIETLENN